MSGKYNTPHNRSRSNYLARLEARGLGKAPLMADIETLRKWASELPKEERERRSRLAQSQLARPLRWE